VSDKASRTANARPGADADHRASTSPDALAAGSTAPPAGNALRDATPARVCNLAGVDTLIQPTASAATAAVAVFVRLGSRHDPPGAPGLAHLYEHMVFKGDAKRDAAEITATFERLGAIVNAATAHEYTVYFAQAPADTIGPTSEALIELVTNPAMREADLAPEREVVLEEIEMYRDRPATRLDEHAMALFFGTHPLGRPIVGDVDAVAGVTPPMLRAWRDRCRQPGRLVVAWTGAIDPEQTVELAESAIRSSAAGRGIGVCRPPGAGGLDVPGPTRLAPSVMHDAGATRGYVEILWPGPPISPEVEQAALLLNDLLGDADSSRLHRALIEPGLADEVDIAWDGFTDQGLWWAYASCDPERAEQVGDALFRTVVDVARGVDPAELERARRRALTAEAVDCESSLVQARRLGETWLHERRVLSLDDRLRRLAAVTVDDVVELARGWLRRPPVVARLIPDRRARSKR